MNGTSSTSSQSFSRLGDSDCGPTLAAAADYCRGRRINKYALEHTNSFGKLNISNLHVRTILQKPSGTRQDCHGNLSYRSLVEISDLSRNFEMLVSEWVEGTENVSSVTQLWNHPAYIKIISIGKPVLPLIFKELQRRPNWWFRALQIITGDNPVPHEYRGNLPEMTRCWLIYAREHGYLEAESQ